MCNMSVLLLCVLVNFIIIWFLFLQIPFYPVVKKDLTFIHLGNDSKIEGLINFEKLRMIAKEVRALTNMCSSPYDLLTMLGLGKTYIFVSFCGLTSAADWVIPAFYCMHDRWTTPFKCHGGTESADNG